MPDIITTGDRDVDDATRRAERDLGSVITEVEHLTEQLADHTTTLDGLKEDKTWIVQRFEAIERDLIAIPRVPEDLATTFSETAANLASRLERLEAMATTDDDDHTDAPKRNRDRSDDRDDRQEEKRPNILDRLF